MEPDARMGILSLCQTCSTLWMSAAQQHSRTLMLLLHLVASIFYQTLRIDVQSILNEAKGSTRRLSEYDTSRELGTNKTLAPTTSLVMQSQMPSMMPSHEPTEEPTTSPVTAAPTPCGNRLFYIITIDGVTKCSNGYDKNADRPDFFETVEDCCSLLVAESIVDADEDCNYVDVCNPTDEPTVSPTAEPITPAPAPKPIPVSPSLFACVFFCISPTILTILLVPIARTHHRARLHVF